MRPSILVLLPLVSALNILISSTDSWVAKNARYLYPALVEAGHDVVYVGSLFNSEAHSKPSKDARRKEETTIKEKQNPPKKIVDQETAEVTSVQQAVRNGDFNHLKASSQVYFKNLRKLKSLSRGAKKIISKKDSEDFDYRFDLASESLVKNASFGQDPLNNDFWYVHGSPLQALSVAFEVILPEHKPGFIPDLVILGPNEGLHLTTQVGTKTSSGIRVSDLTDMDELSAMRLSSQLHDYPVIAVSTEDNYRIYYENEDYFNVEEKSYEKLFKRNSISQNIQFVNSRILTLIDKVYPHMTSGLALNVNFPSLNDKDSACFAKVDGPSFKQVSVKATNEMRILGNLFVVPQYHIKEDIVQLTSERHYRASDSLDAAQEISPVEYLRLQKLLSDVENESALKKKKDSLQLQSVRQKLELNILKMCDIPVSVCNLSKGSSLDESVFDLSSYL